MFETKKSDTRIVLAILAVAVAHLDYGAETVYAIIKHLSPNSAIEYATLMTLVNMFKEVEKEMLDAR